MLRQRVITALVLVAVLLPALFAASPVPFGLLTLAMIAAAGWEWGRLNGAPGAGAVGLGLLLAAACALTLTTSLAEQAPAAMWTTFALVWIVGGAAALRAGPAAWPRLPQALRLVIGLVLLWAGWLALVQARALGINFILSVLCLVWMADIAAYFGGRAFGRRKLAPSISPGKSWAGVWSGQLGVLVLVGPWLMAEAGGTFDGPSLFRTLLVSGGPTLALLSLLALVGMSVVGDLIESLVKRAAGAKDSSRLLPGHGGVLDRIDALLPVFPLAMALVAR